MNLRKVYSNVSILFTVVSVILVIYILKLLFTTGFLYMYFGDKAIGL